jgi:hypothetical protein
MPAVIQGFLVNQLPKDPTAQSFPVVDNIPVNTTRMIHYPDQYKGVAISVAIFNQDGTNPCTFRLNGTSGPAVSLSSGGQFNINDQNIVSVQITTAAITGTCDVVAQISPTYLDTEANRFRRDRG